MNAVKKTEQSSMSAARTPEPRMADETELMARVMIGERCYTVPREASDRIAELEAALKGYLAERAALGLTADSPAVRALRAALAKGQA